MPILKRPALYEYPDVLPRFILSGLNPHWRLYELERKAKEFDLPLSRAVGARRAYLWKEFDFYLTTPVDLVTWDVICLPAMESILKELYQLKMDMFYRSRPQKGQLITDEMKARAKQFPVTTLVEFKHNRASCWVHQDKSPSLYLAPRINKVVCPVCSDKRGKPLMMDPIDILMLRDNYTYFDAVLALNK